MKDKGKSEYLWSMSNAPRLGYDVHWIQLLLPAFFTAVIISLVRMTSYTRPMDQFYWTNAGNDLTDFFSYCKMTAICVCGILAIATFAYRAAMKNLAIKRSVIYVPMLVYVVFVLFSYLASDYKEFAWLGWNDRFEGTAVLLCYMIMLFYVINTINTEKSVKWIIYPVAVVSALLGVLGITQYLNMDFFKTTLGQKLLVPNLMTNSGLTTWQMVDQAAAKGERYLNFTFTDEIYQTVYNINYVSFYLTLLVPLFGMVFIYNVKKGKETPIWKTGLLCALFGLLVFNLIGSESSGGFLGMAAVVALAIIVMNKKIMNWAKPLAILIAMTLLVAGVTSDRWMPEIRCAAKSIDAEKVVASVEEESYFVTQAKLDFIKTEGSFIRVGYGGDVLNIDNSAKDYSKIVTTDKDGKPLNYVQDEAFIYRCTDDRFKDISFKIGMDDLERMYLILDTNGKEWNFRLEDQIVMVNDLGKDVILEEVPHMGWENNPSFGSGRGYIWSTTLPMMKETVIIGHGADTYCIYYPHKDYVGKLKSINYSANPNTIVDKPHNMYMGMWIGTGGISVIAFLTIIGMYAWQSIRWIWKSKFESFLDFAGAGIFFGIVGFLVTGLVDDSSVSVMPMFYGLLGTGIAINMMQNKNVDQKKEK